MKLYKALWITGAAAVIAAAAALMMNPIKRVDGQRVVAVSAAGDISLVIAAALVAVFVVMLIITLVKNKVDTVADKKLHKDNNTVENRILFTSGKYDEEYDSAVKRHKKENDKHRLD